MKVKTTTTSLALSFLTLIISSLHPQLSFSQTSHQENLGSTNKHNLLEQISNRVKLLDIKAPSTPENLTVNPADWTNTDSFVITWQNPEDKSGIKGCFYKLDNLPTSNNDGVYVAGEGINSLTGIKVNTDGAHLIYIWLKDRRNNVDYHNYAVGALKLDRIAPEFVINSPQDESWIGIEYE